METSNHETRIQHVKIVKNAMSTLDVGTDLRVVHIVAKVKLLRLGSGIRKSHSSTRIISNIQHYHHGQQTKKTSIGGIGIITTHPQHQVNGQRVNRQTVAAKIRTICNLCLSHWMGDEEKQHTFILDIPC